MGCGLGRVGDGVNRGQGIAGKVKDLCRANLLSIYGNRWIDAV